jgi:hypothetical protein
MIQIPITRRKKKTFQTRVTISYQEIRQDYNAWPPARSTRVHTRKIRNLPAEICFDALKNYIKIDNELGMFMAFHYYGRPLIYIRLGRYRRRPFGHFTRPNRINRREKNWPRTYDPLCPPLDALPNSNLSRVIASRSPKAHNERFHTGARADSDRYESWPWWTVRVKSAKLTPLCDTFFASNRSADFFPPVRSHKNWIWGVMN